VGLGEAEELDTITALPHSGSSLDPRLRRTRAAPKARSANSGPSSFLRSALRASLDPKYTQRYFHAKVVPGPGDPAEKGTRSARWRHRPSVTPEPRPQIASKPRVIASILRFRLARDMATARSHNSSISSCNSAGISAEGGA
jgi:hypothetical protein